MCRTPLVREARASSAVAVIGDECHIVSPVESGPRGGSPAAELDGYENLILLCPNDHRLIDTLTDEWPVERLLELKRSHEDWVRTTLTKSDAVAALTIVRSEPAALRRLWSGKELVAVAAHAHESSYDHDNPMTEDEVDLVAGFIQAVHDWAEIWSDIEPADRVRATFELDRELKNLEGRGWLVFGERARGKLRGGVSAGDSPWETAYLRLVRTDSPSILRVDWSEGQDPTQEAGS